MKKGILAKFKETRSRLVCLRNLPVERLLYACRAPDLRPLKHHSRLEGQCPACAEKGGWLPKGHDGGASSLPSPRGLRCTC